MNFLTLVLNINLYLCLSLAEIKEEDGIIVLTDKNFDEVVTKDVDILVELYSPDCGFCQLLAPEYVKLAKLLKDEKSRVKIGKVNIEKETKLESRFPVPGVPNIKLFLKGKDIEYEGGVNIADHILTWIHKKIGETPIVLNNKEEYDNFLKDRKAAVIGFFASENSDEAIAFKNASESSFIEFGITHSQELSQKANVKATHPSIVLYKKYDEPEVRYEGKYEPEEIVQFLANESIPLVLDTADQASNFYLENSDITKQIHLISNKKAKNHQEMYDHFKSVAPLYKGKVMFLFSDFKNENSLETVEMTNLKEEDIPAIRIIERSATTEVEDGVEDGAEPPSDIDQGTVLSYKPENKDNLTSVQIRDFIQSYLDGKVESYFTWKESSEEAPEEEQEGEQGDTGEGDLGGEGEQEEGMGEGEGEQEEGNQGENQGMPEEGTEDQAQEPGSKKDEL